jgi:DNA-binding response OmpR family regulator
MEPKTIRVLLIEANLEDVAFLRMVLRMVDGTVFQLETAPTLARGLERMAAGDVDVILLDLTLPDSEGMETFEVVKAQCGGVPVIVLSGEDDETVALRAVHAGAEDYVVKGRVNNQLMSRAIIYALERTEFKTPSPAFFKRRPTAVTSVSTPR